MTRTLQLTDAVYAVLEKAAKAEKMTPDEWLAAHLPNLAKQNGDSAPSNVEIDSDACVEECVVNVPEAVGSNNTQVDADLARAYGGQASQPLAHRGP